MGIVRLEKPPKSPKDLKKMLKEFEGYWQIKLQTLEPYGMNLFDEFYNAEYHDKAGRSYYHPGHCLGFPPFTAYHCSHPLR